MRTDRWRVIEHRPVDLSPEAIALRLRDLSQLDELARSLKSIAPERKHDLGMPAPPREPTQN